jgi:hypothetical protein
MSHAADLTIFRDSIELENIDWEAAFNFWDEHDRWASPYLISDTEIRGPFASEKEAKRWQKSNETLVQAREEDIKAKGLPIVSWPFNNSFV